MFKETPKLGVSMNKQVSFCCVWVIRSIVLSKRTAEPRVKFTDSVAHVRGARKVMCLQIKALPEFFQGIQFAL